MSEAGEPAVFWIDERVLRDELRVAPVRRAGIPLSEWLTTLRGEGMRVELYPGTRTLREPGVAAGGVIVRAQRALDAWAFAVPPSALPALEGLLSPAEWATVAAQRGDAAAES